MNRLRPRMMPSKDSEQKEMGQAVRIEKLVHGGQGLGRLPDGKVVLVEGALPGEEVRICVLKERGSHLEAAVAAVLEASAERAAAPCPFYADCGGCNLQHAVYAAQLRMKTEIVAESLQRAGVEMTEAVLAPAKPSPQQFAYRYRLRLHLGDDGSFGFHRRRSNSLVPVDRCLLATEGINAALGRIAQERQCIAQLAPYAQALEFNHCPASGRIALVLHGSNLRDGRVLKPLSRMCACLGGMADWISTAQGQVLYPLGMAGQDLFLRRQFSHSGLSYELRWPPHAFFQVNCRQNEELVTLAMDAADAPKMALDLFCGSGNFSIPLALLGAQVLGIECSAAGIRWARRNGKEAGLGRIRFIATGAAAGLARLSREGARFDTILLDPPRQGLGKAAALLPQLQPRRIVSISCDPATHARDLRLMQAGGYRLIRLIPVDMFPQTHHIETLAVLERTSANSGC